MTLRIDSPSKRESLRFLREAKAPVVFTGMLESWDREKNWIPQRLADIFAERPIRFRIIPKTASKSNSVLWETECRYIEATIEEFLAWNSNEKRSKKPKTDTGLWTFNPTDYTAYADYKYMKDTFSTYPDLMASVDWTKFGLDEKSSRRESVFWMGGEGAHTPCHYDTYGFNLVAQLSGRKRWTLFSPEQSRYLYPTRVPYEESSVFSRVNVGCPDLGRFSMFSHAHPVEIVLEPGEVLFVPKHWWHYVECLDLSVSVNVWTPMDSDDADRLNESITRTVIFAIQSQINNQKDSSWMCPSESFSDFDTNLSLLSRAYAHLANTDDFQVSSETLLEALLHPEVVQLVARKLSAGNDS